MEKKTISIRNIGQNQHFFFEKEIHLQNCYQPGTPDGTVSALGSACQWVTNHSTRRSLAPSWAREQPHRLNLQQSNCLRGRKQRAPPSGLQRNAALGPRGECAAGSWAAYIRLLLEDWEMHPDQLKCSNKFKEFEEYFSNEGIRQNFIRTK